MMNPERPPSPVVSCKDPENNQGEAGATPASSEARQSARIEDAPTHTDGPVGGHGAISYGHDQALCASELKYRRLFESARDGILILDSATGRINDVNPYLHQLLGLSRDDIIGKTVGELSPFKDIQSNKDMLECLQKTGYVRYDDLPLSTKAGRHVDVEFVCNAYRAGDKQVIQCNIRDITENKRVENTLRSNNENMVIAQSIAHFGSWEMTLTDQEAINTNSLRWSDEMYRIAGYEPGQVVVSNELFFGLIPKNEHQSIRDAIKAAIRDRRQYMIIHRLIRPNGEERLVQEVAQIYYDEKTGRPLKILGTAHDITEQKRTEARFRRLVDSNAQGVIFWGTNGEITGANDAFLRLVRYSREDLEASRLNWMSMTPLEYASLDRRALDQMATIGICEPYEKDFIRKDGSRVPVLLGAALFEDNWNEGVSFVVDLTERKRLEQQYLRAQRIESIGTLAGGIAHDLNNILAPILLSIEILKSISTDPDAREILETIEVSARRGADIVRQVLTFARGLEGDRAEIQPRHLLRDLEHIIKDTFPKDIRLRFTIQGETWPILGDATQMHQILLNLAVNARDAMPNGGFLAISVENYVLDEHNAKLNPKAKPGRYVLIKVTDSGQGIPAEILHRIFEPFFTTKPIGKGTGLGLSTVMAIVKSHEGVIIAQSEPGKGSTFNIYLPAMDSCPDIHKTDVSKTRLPRGNGEMILVVDDESSIRRVTTQTLQSFGYRVLTATDGADAVGVYVQHQDRIEAVITDMMMPIMGGQAMIHALTRINPDIKIIATSGLSINGGAINESGALFKHFLIKPYTAETLLNALRNVLGEK